MDPPSAPGGRELASLGERISAPLGRPVKCVPMSLMGAEAAST